MRSIVFFLWRRLKKFRQRRWGSIYGSYSSRNRQQPVDNTRLHTMYLHVTAVIVIVVRVEMSDLCLTVLAIQGLKHARWVSCKPPSCPSAMRSDAMQYRIRTLAAFPFHYLHTHTRHCRPCPVTATSGVLLLAWNFPSTLVTCDTGDSEAAGRRC
jgi:hypothetical protein